MRTTVVATVIVFVALSSGAALQAASPEPGHAALGISGGLSVPFEGAYKAGFLLDGTFDY